MKNYAYGILVDRNTYPGITFYNEGRKEVFIKELEFNFKLRNIPELIIKK